MYIFEFFFSFFLFNWFLFGVSNSTNPIPPLCINSEDELVYVNHSLSASQTFYNCLANVPDGGLLPSYYNGGMYGPITFSTGITLNNLIEVSQSQ